MLSLSKVRRLASEFEPDAVVTLMQDSWYYELAAKYARRHRLPLVLFIHDLPNIFAPVPNWLRAMQRRRDMSIYAQAVVRFCVSEGMESWFRTQFGIEGDVLLPPRSSRCPSQDPTKCAKLKRPKQLTLGFAGGLHYGYGEQIKNLVPVLRETKTRLELFGPMPSGRLQSLLDETDVLQFNGYATTPEKAWDSLIQRCDALLLPYLNPPGKHQLQYQTHFPSKLGDMLSSGLPLLICGPQEASGVAWFDSRQQAAAIVTPASPSDVRTTIERLRADSNLRIELAREALRLARSFDTDSLSSDFRKSLNRLNIIRQYT